MSGAAAGVGKISVNQGFQSIFTTIPPTQLGETAVGNSVVTGAESLASFLDYLVRPLVAWDEATYGYGEVACTAQAFGGW